MESLKANSIIIAFIVIILGLGFWAVKSVQNKVKHVADLSNIEDVGPVVTSSAFPDSVPVTYDDGGVSGGTDATDSGKTDNSNTETTNHSSGSTTTSVDSSVDKNADLVSKLQGLIDDKVFMKKGSRGTRVGTVQKFLIAYGVSMKIDNDYGDSTVTGVKKFQTAEKLSVDGQTGPETYKKMIDWLNKN